MDAPRARNPQAVLFACGLNSVRSPMAESLLRQMFPQALYVKSAGVRKAELDPFAVSVMAMCRVNGPELAVSGANRFCSIRS